MSEQRKMFYRERVYTCGHYKHVEIFPVYQRAGVRRSKCNPTSDVQKKLNDKHSKEHFMRLLHENFNQDDYVIGLDYRESCLPEDDTAAKKDITNFLRRVKRLYKRFSEELKYIMVYERSERGRPHFHVIMQNAGIATSLIRSLWYYGRTEIEPLQYDEDGIMGLCKYVTKGNLFKKRWCASKNLRQPVPVDSDYKLTQKKVKAFQIEDLKEIRNSYGDGNILSCNVYNNDVNRADYISIVMFDYGALCKEMKLRHITQRKDKK